VAPHNCPVRAVMCPSRLNTRGELEDAFWCRPPAANHPAQARYRAALASPLTGHSATGNVISVAILRALDGNTVRVVHARRPTKPPSGV
jgi:hypothetical protein